MKKKKKREPKDISCTCSKETTSWVLSCVCALLEFSKNSKNDTVSIFVCVSKVCLVVAEAFHYNSANSRASKGVATHLKGAF